MSDLADIREQVRARLDWPMMATLLGWEIKKSGVGTWSMCCPFHAEKSASFVMGGASDKFRDRSHCFGCSDGDHDFFSIWQTMRGVDHKQAVLDLAAHCGVSVGTLDFFHEKGKGITRTSASRLGVVDAPPDKTSLPSLQRLNDRGCAMIAESRGIPLQAVCYARDLGRVVYQRWPLHERSGQWLPRCAVHGKRCTLDHPECEPVEVWPSWGATDRTLTTVEFRRLDNGKYPKFGTEGIKAWGLAGKAWPLGAREVEQCKWVMLVEGGPDMIAAYALLARWRMLGKVVVVCMLGASNPIRKDALPCFAGARVRIMVDADTPKDDENPKKRVLPGLQAASRWQTQLQEAGAAVELFYVGDLWSAESVEQWQAGKITAAEMVVEVPGFTLPDGKKVKDVNELLHAGDEVLNSEDVRQACRDWDF